MLEVKALEEKLADHKRQLAALDAEVGDNVYSEDQKVRFDDLSNTIAEVKEQLDTAKRREQVKALQTKPVSFSETYRPVTVDANDRHLALTAWCMFHAGDPKAKRDITPRMREAVERCGWDLSSNSVVSFDQTMGTAGEGGNLLDGSIYKGLIERTKQTGNLLQYANVETTPGDGQIHLATVDATGRTLTKITELGEVSDTPITFGKVQLDSYHYATGVFPISYSLQRSANFPIVPYVVKVLGDTIGRGFNKIWTTDGDGNGDPESLTTGLTTGVTAEEVDDIDFNELEDLISSVDPSYYYDSAFYMNRNTHVHLCRKADEQQVPGLYRQSWRDGEPDSLLGFKVRYLPDLPNIGAGTVPVIFGNLKEAFTIRLAGSVNIQTSKEKYWLSQATAVGAWASMDSAVTGAHAAKKLVMASS